MISLVVAVDINLSGLKASVGEYEKRLVLVEGDITDRATSERAVSQAVAIGGHLNSIILNAGILRPVGEVSQTEVSDWKRLFDVNFFALLHTVSLVLIHTLASQLVVYVEAQRKES